MFPFGFMNYCRNLKYIFSSFVVIFGFNLFVDSLAESEAGSMPFVVLKDQPAVELKRLRSDLLKNYDRTLRPLKDQDKLSTVGVFFDVHHIISMDEKYQILSVKGQLMLFWTDEFLRWDPENYSHIKKVHFFPDEIWRPEIDAEYNVKLLNIYEKGRAPPVTIFSNGSTEWFPQVQFDVPCNANYRHYPFDSHNCSVTVMARDDNVQMVLQRPYWKKSGVLLGTEWQVKRIDRKSEDITEPRLYTAAHRQVVINLFLERTSRIYRYICVIPTLISMVTLLFGFWLLPSETSRYLIGCGNIIVLSMLLQHLALTIPAGRDVPLIAQYSASCLSMSAVFVIITVISNLLRESNGTAPIALVRLAHFTADRYLCIYTFSHVQSESQIVLDAGSHGGSATSSMSPDELKRRKDWYAVSVFMDRIAFWSFCFIFVVLLSVLASI